MMSNKKLCDFTDREIKEEFYSRELEEKKVDYQSISDFDDCEISREYESRGLREDEDQPDFKLAEEIYLDWQQGRCVENRLKYLIEQMTGRVVCK